ncbi:anti-sigma factor [Altererythrobacter sp. ZODW24]|uniref:anti-sigma factor n=1 Tax=Altererythrobacter sp. ZODW24 TaxID=2185142 RepID=UPI000DF76F3C|nr:anti-sigma factor [Altererythrobacter sp. ZODW24]
MNERSRLAAEHALGLLTGEEAMQAHGLMANDGDFAAEVAEWEDRLAPLMDELPDVEPGPELWNRIEAAMAEPTRGAEVVTLRKRLRNWQLATGLSAAAAVALAVFVFPTQGPVAVQEAPLVASIPIGDTQLRVGVTFLPERDELLVSASGLTADGVHDHELWLVDDAGQTRSLGVVEPGFERRVTLEPALASTIANGSDLVLTREPLGGAPAGGSAGPVVASGEFATI